VNQTNLKVSPTERKTALERGRTVSVAPMMDWMDKIKKPIKSSSYLIGFLFVALM